ncbi:hypothetical protein L6164_016525 [Bauhinia variegata]|uniref:Uncharacterized protein n=1 Tax=Bauhinia variegata TaxID=167791 RepID=A0ACB9NQ87_BAUVA|nr:hypothetical protein L6164_016525 [Bauhinia variegata]
MRTSVFLCLYAWLVSYSHVCLAGDTLKAGDRIIGNNITLVSSRKVFQLGFFSPSDDSTYLGIWYYESKPKTVVWVANRDKPVIRYNGVFEIAEDGNLKVLSPNGVHWSSELKGFSAANRTVMLMDSGNLVLVDNHSGNILWQSFEHPTDTFLPGMKMNKDLNLTCWMADDDPRPGNYTFKQGSAGVNNYIISRKQGQLYWESDNVGEAISGLVVHLLTNIAKEVYSTDEWSRIWVAPENLCRRYNYCGNFSSCSTRTSFPCKCLPGFSLRSPHGIGEIGDNGYWPQPDEKGCVRKSEPSRENTTFINLQEVTVGNPDLRRNVDEAECESLCRNMSSECQAFSYEFTEKSTSTCWIWKTDLTTVEEEYLEHGRNLSVRVNNLDIASTPRTCKPCGTYIIPYPLSTGPDCGDPTYSNFSCNNRTDNVMFKSNYTVISINPTKRMFYINSSNTYCNHADENQHIEFHLLFTATGIGKCICDTSYGWNDSTLSCTSQATLTEVRQPPISRGNSTSRLPLILVVVLISIIILGCIIISLYVWKKKMAHKQDRESINRIQGRMFDSARQVKDLIDLEGLQEKDNEGIGVPYFDFESILEATDNFSDVNKLGRGGYGPVYKGKLQEVKKLQ